MSMLEQYQIEQMDKYFWQLSKLLKPSKRVPLIQGKSPWDIAIEAIKSDVDKLDKNYESFKRIKDENSDLYKDRIKECCSMIKRMLLDLDALNVKFSFFDAIQKERQMVKTYRRYIDGNLVKALKKISSLETYKALINNTNRDLKTTHKKSIAKLTKDMLNADVSVHALEDKIASLEITVEKKTEQVTDLYKEQLMLTEKGAYFDIGVMLIKDKKIESACKTLLLLDAKSTSSSSEKQESERTSYSNDSNFKNNSSTFYDRRRSETSAEELSPRSMNSNR